MRYTHAWGDTPWKELELSDCSTKAWNAPRGMEGYAMCDNGDKLTLNYARYANGEEREVVYFMLDDVKFVPERTCRIEQVYLDNYSVLTVDVCSNCRVTIDNGCYYCPNCGAKVVDK